MDTKHTTLDIKQFFMIIVTMINILVLGPLGWIISELWTTSKLYVEDTKNKLSSINTEIHALHIETAKTYVTKKEFSEFWHSYRKEIEYLDSKIEDKSEATY